MSPGEIDLLIEMCAGPEAARFCLMLLHQSLFDMAELAVFFQMGWKVIVWTPLGWPIAV